MSSIDFDIENHDGVFIIAEISANHNGSLNVALDTIKAAKTAGADAVKIQTYTPDSMTLNSNNDDFILEGTVWQGERLYDLYSRAQTPYSWHKDIFDYANSLGLMCFSSPFDIEAVDFLENLGCPVYKIASFEITDIPLIKYAASKGKPMIISTGIATDIDIEMAIEACKSVGNNKITLLKCTSSYPAPIDESNLVMINDFKSKFEVSVGLSDHTLGITLPIVATVMGAKMIEKHLILDKSIGGPDASFSLDFNEFSKMVNSVREAEKSIGKVSYKLTEKQEKGRRYSRSIYISKNIRKGELLSNENIKIVRPGMSLHPKYYQEIIGKPLKHNKKFGERLSLDEIDFS